MGKETEQKQEIVNQGVHTYSQEEAYVWPEEPVLREQLEWFQDQKLALMVHWGVYNQLGMVASWALSDEDADRYLEEITAAVNIPVLRKDFTVDEYMIYQAKAFGASAVLLICAILDDVQLREYRQLAESLGLDALVEAHDEREVERALEAGAKIVGVNNRDLRTFRVDMNNSIRLRNLAPEEVVFVSESGIRTSADINLLYDNRVDAVLIGETLMRSPDKKVMLETLNGKPLSR